MLQLVVHGINCTETNHLGMSPFFAVFGRDPVGLAELEWPEIQRLDTDGDTFVRTLADNIRTIWSTLKATSDDAKRRAAEKLNLARNESAQKPLKPGDFVFVEHGDEMHSKRMGKAGLPRRRRFRVLESHPDRGYVRIDTDGVNIMDKVSLGRVTRAPSWYTVTDTSSPITKLERRGDLSLPLPPGWKALLKHGATRDYQVYAGPGGSGTANTPLDAWRQYNNDPVYMPQPKLTSAALPPPQPKATDVPMLPSLYKVLPKASGAVATPSSLAKRTGPTSTADCPACQGKHRAHTCGKGMLNKPAATTITAPQVLQRGQRVRVHWTLDDVHYDGVVTTSRIENGRTIHRIAYDDGIPKWHDMAKESWVLLGADGQPVGRSVQSMVASIAETRAYSSARRSGVAQLLAARRDADLRAFLLVCEVGDDLCNIN